MNDFIENKVFDDIHIGDEVSLTRTLTFKDIEIFAIMSGDINPAHVDQEYAKNDLFHGIIGHGMWSGALISTLLGTQLPGPGTIYIAQTLQFRYPVRLGDTITVTITAIEKNEEKKRIIFDCRCTHSDGKDVVIGAAEVIAPTEKIKRQRIHLPSLSLDPTS